MGILDKLKEVGKSIEDGISDLTSLDVVTITGTINIKTDSAGNTTPAAGQTAAGTDGGNPDVKPSSPQEPKPLQLQELHKDLMNQVVSAKSDFSVLAFTHIDMDADSTNYVRSDLSAEDAALVHAHNEMVKTAQETRMGAIRMLMEMARAGLGL